MGEWFEDESFWSELYPFMFPEERFRLAEEQIEKVLALAGYKEGAVLDLCCGPGRHSLALAKHGIQVTAVDLSECLLRKAKEEAAKLNLEIEFVSDDMRHFVRSNSFSLILNMLTSFGYFDDKEDDLKALRNAYQSLKPEGAIVIDLFGKELLARKYQATSSMDCGDGVLLIQRHEICEDWTRCRNEWILVKDGTAKTFNFQTRLYSGQEMKDILQRAGFEEVKVFGDLDGNDYGVDADRLIAVGRKKV
ncbi:MAG TPA: class I SAM-dependent methyltransferase [Blastocatellia bacterium]|jgi:SAM-dependent methyltransferase|nr:class I SAM-dependent methyltransferase [Blastocatellia bacterium]